MIGNVLKRRVKHWHLIRTHSHFGSNMNSIVVVAVVVADVVESHSPLIRMIIGVIISLRLHHADVKH